jgi:hypothetical protein
VSQTWRRVAAAESFQASVGPAASPESSEQCESSANSFMRHFAPPASVTQIQIADAIREGISLIGRFLFLVYLGIMRMRSLRE